MKLTVQFYMLLKSLHIAKCKLVPFFLQEFKAHEDTLLVWRTRIFLTIFFSTILVGALAYVPNMKISLQSGDWLTALIYTTAYLVVISITLVRIIPFKIRVWIGLFVFYVIGLTSFLTFGPIGSGRIWLFAFAVLSCLLLGLKAGLFALCLNVCTILFLAIFQKIKYVDSSSFIYSPLEYWLTTGLSFLFLSVVIIVSLGILVDVLEKNLQKEKSLTKELKLSNKRLEQENDERQLVEKSLRKSQERYKTLTNNLHVGVYRISAHPKDKFLEANPKILQMFGYISRKEFLDINVVDLFQNPDEGKEFNKKMIKRGFLQNQELQFRKKNGDIIICSVSAAAIKDKSGNLMFYDGVIEDITDRKHLESQFQQAQKMKAVGTLAGGVAHDLNNILSGIVSYPELILMDLPEESPLREPIKTIQESGKKAAAIVQDLLTLARRGVSISEIINLNDIISEYLDSPEFDKLKSFHPLVEVQTRIDSELLNIMGSPVHLSKSIMNLVSNAAEAMPEGGKMLISTENLYVDRPISGYNDIEEGDYVVLIVSDTGIGIADKEIERIFEPFYTKKVMGRSGTGLGMAVVWGTVKDHKGYINVDSNLGEGTTIKLYFPVTRKKRLENQGSKKLDDYRGKGESILVVDDVKEQREIASKILLQLGYSVKTVNSGEEAVKLLKRKNVDLIVLDMIMPGGIDGLETYKRIINLHPKQKAIIASGFSETMRVKKAQQLGAGKYVKKPYTIEKIGLAIKAEIRKNKKAA